MIKPVAEFELKLQIRSIVLFLKYFSNEIPEIKTRRQELRDHNQDVELTVDTLISKQFDFAVWPEDKD